MKRLCFLMGLIASIGFLANQVGAFSLSPASLELEIKRGESQTQVLNVYNDAEKPISCQIAVSGYEVLADGKQRFEDTTPETPSLIESKMLAQVDAANKLAGIESVLIKAAPKPEYFPASAASWIKATKPKFEVAGKSSGKAEVTIAVPKTAQPGDYFACIFAQTQAPKKAKTTQGVEVTINVNFRLGCTVRITVPGTVQKKAEVSKVEVEMPSAESADKGIKIMATLANKCPLHLDARGEVLVKNSKNRVYDKFVLQGAGKNAKGEALVYPMGSREFSGTVQRPLPAGEYIAEVAFNYGYRSQKAKAQAKFTVSPEVGEKQKEFLTLTVEPNPLEVAGMLSGALRARPVKVFNLDFEPLAIKVVSQVPWIVVEPTEFTVGSGKEKSLRVLISVPANEPVARVGKIVLTPERGKPVIVDIIVSAKKEREK